MNQPVLNWVVALKPEAQPIIEGLKLKQEPELSGGGFSVFQNPNANHRLIISGIGKVNAAAATAWLGQTSEKWDSWLNLGIAGNRIEKVGTILRAGRITDSATGKSWYPTAVWPRKQDRFEVTEVVTVDQPTSNYPEPRQTIEMEAAGFLPTALRFSSSELVHTIKIISDNHETDLADLKPASVREMVEKAVPDILEWIPCLETVSNEEFKRLSLPEGWEPTISAFHFTETEKHQLKRLTARALTLGHFESLTEWCAGKNFQNGKEILKVLEELLSNAKRAED